MGKVAFTFLVLLVVMALVVDSWGLFRRRRRRRRNYVRRRTIIYRPSTSTLSRLLRQYGSLKSLMYSISSRTASINSKLSRLISNIGRGVSTTRRYIRNKVNSIYKIVRYGHKYKYGDYLKEMSDEHQTDYDAMVASLSEELQNDYGADVASLITNALDYAIRNDGDETPDEDQDSLYKMIAEAITDDDEDATQYEDEIKDEGDDANDETIATEDEE